MKFKFFLFSIFLSSFFISGNTLAQVGNLSNEQVKALMEKNIPIIDIRRSDEWRSTGVIEGSHLLTFFDARGNFNLDKWLADLDKIAGKNDQFILVCRSGNRTGQVANFLDQKLGYSNVNHLKKGIKKWIKPGNKVVYSQ